jgi:hypothetical protein
MPLDEPARAALSREIEVAFGGVSLGDGIGILEAWAIDRCLSDKERQSARSSDIRSDWTLVSDEMIDAHYSALSFMDREGLRFALPAYMRFAVRNFDKSQSLSVDAPIYSLGSGWPAAPDGPDIFSPSQRAAIAKFLRFMVLEVGDEFVDANAASEAYEYFWLQYDEEA